MSLFESPSSGCFVRVENDGSCVRSENENENEIKPGLNENENENKLCKVQDVRA